MTKRRILLVEPDAGLASMVERFLGRADFEVAIARDGLLGFKLAADINPHLVLVDIGLDSQPEGGFLLGKSFRQDVDLKNIPLVLMVPEDFDDKKPARIDEINKVFDGFLYKPFADTELKRVVENFTGFGESGESHIQTLDKLLDESSDIERNPELKDLVKDLRDKKSAEIGKDSSEILTNQIKQLETDLKDRDKIIKERDKRIDSLLDQLSDMELDHSFAIETLETEKGELDKKIVALNERIEDLEKNLKETMEHITKARSVLKMAKK